MCISPRTPIPADLYSSATNAQLRFVQDIPVPQVQPETENMWDDVYMAIDDAIARYQNHGRIREASRKLGDNAKTIQSWLTLFPNTSYSSTLCGGIKLILDVSIA